MSKSYYEKLKDPQWQKKRLEVFQLHNFKCQICSSTENTLHVHHKIYRKGCEPWEYATKDLCVLCDSCHLRIEEYKTKFNELVSQLSPDTWIFLFDFLNAFGQKGKNSYRENMAESLGTLYLLSTYNGDLVSKLRDMVVNKDFLDHCNIDDLK